MSNASPFSGIDLSGLDEVADVMTRKSRPPEPSGKPMSIAIALIDPDPQNDREEFDEEELRELAATIQGRGIKEPLSVRSHPSSPGRYVLNSGERRWRAAQLLGLTEVPIFIDDHSDPIDRFIVNEQRANLTPMEVAKALAKFCETRSQTEIATSIGKTQPYISAHLALLSLPPSIKHLYDRRICRRVNTLTALSGLHKKDSALVDEAIAGMPEISISFLDELRRRVEGTEDGDTATDTTDESSEKPSAKPKKSAQKKSKGEPSKMTVVVKHEGKHYQLVGTFLAPRKPRGTRRVLIQRGRDEPQEIDIELLELDSITYE